MQLLPQIFRRSASEAALSIDPNREQKLISQMPTLSPAASSGGGGWWPFSWIREAFPGAWQRNIETPIVDVLTHGTVFACITLIASDIAKMGLRLVALDSDGIWTEKDNSAYSPVLRKPNHFQTRIMFIMQWVISKLTWGNTYVLKERDNRGVVVALYILDPSRVQVLVAPDGGVYYDLKSDKLADIPENLPAVPASEIIHDVFYPIYHPLVGLSPIHACGLAAIQGLRIQTNSAKFFANGSNPGGVLTAPGAISDETAKRMKEYWETNYTGSDNVGKVAVLGDGLKFEGMGMKAVDAQLIDQLKWTGSNVCTTFHVPEYKVGVGAPPAATNIEALDRQYYSQCLQILIECIEALLDEGLAIIKPYGTEFNLDDLWRLDSATLMTVVSEGIGAAVFAPNEGRKKFNLPPVKGGDTPYLQQQNYSLAALDARDKAAPAPSTATPPPDPAAAQPPKPKPGATATPPPVKDFALDDFELALKMRLAQLALEQEFVDAA